jgi:hypothetical protein
MKTATPGKKKKKKKEGMSDPKLKLMVNGKQL